MPGRSGPTAVMINWAMVFSSLPIRAPTARINRMAEPPQQQQQPPAPTVTGAGRFIAGVFGVAFAAIGLTVIGTLWFGDGMGDPPVIFKLIGSLIALVFVAMGGTIAFGAITGGGLMAQQREPGATTTATSLPAAS